ncbi:MULTISPECIES: bZIP transcription factor [Bacillaceae]|uniref:BZIP transcription factor n=1 Tax=Evansella alkalicola TaxID=745819 RepID=A0ABS6JWB8_9BACI|nr:MULTISPECIES: bZIP transcription factor [Bacillaceae]MBU9722885.1 bZIP transcription factor [Bacillus alkalicola]
MLSKTHLGLLVVGIFVLGVSFLFSDPINEAVDSDEFDEGAFQQLEKENAALVEENARLQEKVNSLEKSLENFGKSTTVYMNRDAFMRNAQLSKTTEFIFEEQLETGLMVIYKDEVGYRHSYYSTKNGFWANSDYANVSEVGVSWTVNHEQEVPLISTAGLITNENISDIIVRHDGRKREARIVNVDDNRRVWYTLDELLVPEFTAEPVVTIEALSADGTLLWKN